MPAQKKKKKHWQTNKTVFHMPWLTTSEKKKWGRGKNGPFYKGSDGNEQQETAGKRKQRTVLILLILKQLFLFLFTAFNHLLSTNSSDYHLLVAAPCLIYSCFESVLSDWFKLKTQNSKLSWPSHSPQYVFLRGIAGYIIYSIMMIHDYGEKNEVHCSICNY